MIKINDLIKIYYTENGCNTKAIDNISLSLPDTGMVFILGKSGCGKSTLLNLIGGLDKPTAGEIIINGQSSKCFSSYDYDIYRNTYIGFIFQDYNLIEDLSVRDNVALALKLQNRKSTTIEVEEALNLVELGDFIDRKPNELSGGQKQRVAIARALIKNPQIILADEPTGSLDSETGKKIFSILKNLSKDRLIIVASHDEESAKKYGSRIINIADGKITSDTHESIPCSTNNYQLTKRPSLPLMTALKISSSNFKKKKVRFCLSILLSAISFSMFGVFVSLNLFKENKALTKALSQSEYGAITIEKTINESARKKVVFDEYGENTYEYDLKENAKQKTLFTQEDLSYLKDKNIASAGVFLPKDFDGIYYNDYEIEQPLNIYYESTDKKIFVGFCDCGEEFCNSNFTLVEGKFPTLDTEIAISLHKAEALALAKAKNNIDELIGENITLSNKNGDYFLDVSISGIYKTNDIPSKYDEIKTFPGYKDVELVTSWQNYKKNSFMDIAFVGKGFYDTNIGYYDYDRSFIGTAKLVSPVNLYSIVEDNAFAHKNPEHLYSVSNVIPYDFFKSHMSEFEIKSIDGDPTALDKTLNDNEILVSEDYRIVLNRYKYESLINDIKEFYNLSGYFSYPLETYSKDAHQTFESEVFKKAYNNFKMYLNDFARFEKTENFTKCYKYLDGQVAIYFDKLSKRDVFCDAVINTCNADGQPIDEYMDKLCSDDLNSDEYNLYKALCSELINAEIQDGVIDFSEENWDSLENIYKTHYNNTVGTYRALSYFWRLMPYSNAEQEFENVSSGKDEGLRLAKEINDKYDSKYDVICEKLLSGDISRQDLDKIVNVVSILKGESYTISKYKYGFFVERYPYETSLDLQTSSKSIKIKTMGVVGFKNQSLGSFIVANPNTLKTLSMSISEDNELLVNTSKYEYSNKGKYCSLLAINQLKRSQVDAINSSFGTYSFSTTDYCSIQLRSAVDSTKSLITVSGIAGLVFAVFSSLLLFNFISGSVTDKEKEIGILRSLGASTKDVFKVFISEAAIVSALSFILANVFGLLFVTFINRSLIASTMNIALFDYDLLIILIVTLSTILVSFVSSIYPIVKICKKNTVDAIKKCK